VGSAYGRWDRPDASASGPPVATHERTRSYVFLPALNTGSSVTVVLYDRVHAQRADLAVTFANDYFTGAVGSPGADAQHNRARDMAALEQAACHAGMPPSFSGHRASWAARPGSGYGARRSDPGAAHTGAGGFPATCDFLLPAPSLHIVISPGEVGPVAGLYPYELGWQIRTLPVPPLPATNLPRSTRFLQINQAADSGVVCANDLVQSSSGEAADGALCRCTGEPDKLVLFGSKPLDRTFRGGFTVTWTSVATTTLVYVFDLDRHASAWHTTLDGGGSTLLTPTAAGVGRVAVSGAGSHTLVIVGS
jgi:hypothetical protein